MKISKIVFFALLLGNICYGQDHGHAHEEEAHKGNHQEREADDEHEQHEYEGDRGHDEHGESAGGHAGHEGHGSSKAIGKGKAIEEVDERQGFKMSKEAKETIGVKLRKASGGPLTIPKDALVVSLEERGIYRYRNGFFKMLPVEIQSEDKGTFTVVVNGLRAGDEIAVEGVGLLRVTDVYSTDTSEYGHGH